MAQSTEPRDTPRRGVVRYYRNVPVGAAAVIYAGCLVGISAAGNAGLLSGTTYTKPIGRACETVDNTAGAAGALTVDVERGEFFVDNDATNALTKAHIGPLLENLVEWSDDHTAANAANLGAAVGGTVTEVTSTGVWVEIR